ncbi:hypothetical protein D9756_011505 [Leucocoprinus leucothites]|uniref:Uncharacterized protein n=1 Tax=Leucocoprinus leucothites TaxID=201217 RepID=A0A8H5CQ14_9AGAR|nr:hypothetical protein D9756_011505 [Leucoagaricus leucothites]
MTTSVYAVFWSGDVDQLSSLTTKTMFSHLTLLALFASIFSAYAQTFERRRSSPGRIIAGCVIAGIAFILFIIGFCLLARRKRARAAAFRPGFSGQPGPYSRGWFGGPYQADQSAPPPPPHGQYGAPGMMHHDVYGQNQQHGLEGSKYPMQPPPYANDGNAAYGQFSHPQPASPQPVHTK